MGLENRSNTRMSYSLIIAIVIYTTALLCAGFAGMYMFGDQLRPDLLANISTRDGFLSVLIRIVYCVVLLFHLPYIFFTVKEYALVIFDEVQNKSLSEHLEQKLEAFLQRKANTPRSSSNRDDENRPLLAGENNDEPVQNDEVLEVDPNRGQPETENNGERKSQDAESNQDSIQSDKSELTYKTLPDSVQWWMSLWLHVGILTLAIVIKDISVI